MDFLDPQKTKARNRQLYLGYALIGILILLGTVILVYLSYGFGLSKEGKVYQNGLVYVSSQPVGAAISVNSTSYGTTNKALTLPSGQYLLKLNKTGYRPWQRSINVDGATVQHFDYPLLIPAILTSSKMTNYATQPSLTLQSPDRHWLIVQQPGSLNDYQQFDLNTLPLKAPTSFTLPVGLLSPSTGPVNSLKLVEWSTDNIHILLEHQTSSGFEYILLDRQTPASSINLNRNLNIPIGQMQIKLWDISKFNQYYVYDQTTKDLYTTKLSDSKLTLIIHSVLSYKSYGSNIILYVSDSESDHSKVAVKVKDGKNIYTIRSLISGSNYLVDLAQNNGNWFYVVASTIEGRAYVYENPVQSLQADPTQPLPPVDILKVEGVNFIAFSADTKNILAENGVNIETYDNFANKNYSYVLPKTLDAPQANVEWMDGERLTFVGANQAYILDYDGINLQKLVTNLATVPASFNQNYKYIYTISLATDKASNGQAATGFNLNQTPLRLKADL